ncbi:NAD+ synthase [Candidatus Bipolaricaulota bacterium]|nr:NAD+ synthase [Candidatus Bipolaricaulota bacterium]
MGLAEHIDQFDPESEVARVEEFIARAQSKIGFNNVIIGLSGGIDSSLTAVLAGRALPDQKLEVVFLPEAATPDRDRSDVARLAEKYSLEVRDMEIDNFVSAFQEKLGEMSELTAANLKARIRMVVLYTLANRNDGLVLGTGNLSEWLLGYFTKYGDGAADLAPITHLYKTEINVMTRYLEIPESIISKPPSAGLWEGQSDEEELGGSYEEIDKILYLKHDRDCPLEEAQEALDLDPNFVKDIYDMVAYSAHKREEPAAIDRK